MRRLRVLGPLEVDGAAEVLGPRDRVVVSALALRPGERVDAETLAEALWGEDPPASAAKVVQGCVSRLRQGAGRRSDRDRRRRLPRALRRARHRPEQFEDLVGAGPRVPGHRAPRSGRSRCSTRRWPCGAGRPSASWRTGCRAGSRPSASASCGWPPRRTCCRPGSTAVTTPAWPRPTAPCSTGQQPFRERRWALLALAQYRSGRQADALGSIRSARRALGQELGLDPGSELVALERAILAQDPGLATDHEARVADASLPVEGTRAVRRPTTRHLLRA